MAAAKTQSKSKAAASEAEEYDFDSWTEEAEEAALKAMSAEAQYILVGGDFVGRFPSDHKVVRLSLALSVDLIAELDGLEGGPIEQFKAVLEKLSDKKTAAEFTKRDAAEALSMAHKFFTVLEKKQAASLGE